MMNLLDELVTAYLDNNFEHPYYLDVQTGEVILNMDEVYTGEPGIDWDDDENIDRYIDVPKIDSNEAFYVMTKFAKSTESDPEEKLFDALDGRKPFRRFKDFLYELDLWDEWNDFEYKYAEKMIRSWVERFELDFEELEEKYKKLLD
jgi:phage-related protein